MIQVLRRIETRLKLRKEKKAERWANPPTLKTENRNDNHSV